MMIKNTITTIAALFTASVALGTNNCESKISGYGDSHVFRVKETMGLLEYGQAKDMIVRSVKKLCKQDDVHFDVLSCSQIVPGNAGSVVCYAETNIGYFFVHNDMINTTTITWNRYD